MSYRPGLQSRLNDTTHQALTVQMQTASLRTRYTVAKGSLLRRSEPPGALLEELALREAPAGAWAAQTYMQTGSGI